MACRVTIYFIGLSIMPILVVASGGSKSAYAQAKLDAYYTATLLGLPIGHISWVVDLRANRFSSVATGSIAGFLRLFLDAQGSVAAEGRLSGGKPVPSKFQLKLLAGKWSDEVGIVFTGNRAKESVLPTSASPSADYVPIKDDDRVGASDPMTALLIYVGGWRNDCAANLRANGGYFRWSHTLQLTPSAVSANLLRGADIMNFVIHRISFMTYLSRVASCHLDLPHALRYPFEMSDAAPFIAPALLVAYLAIGCLLFWGRAARP